MMFSSLACVLVHYGSAEVTAACVASLLSGTVRPWTVIVCNTTDSDTHALLAVLRAAHPYARLGLAGQAEGRAPEDILLLPQSSNGGFAHACNVGLRLALQQEGIKYAWLLNNDTTVAPDAAERLLRCVKAQPRALVGTSVFRADAPDRLELALGCRFSPLTTVLTPCHAGALPEDVRQSPQVDYIYGASLAFSLSLVREQGFLEEDYFLYYEEHDFCLRARRAGYAFHWCREAVVWHGVVREGKAHPPSKTLREFKHFHESRSTALFLRKHYPAYMLPALGLRTVGKLVMLLRRQELWLCKSYFQGLWAGLRGK